MKKHPEEKTRFQNIITFIRLINFSRKIALKEVVYIGVISGMIGITSFILLFSLEGLIDAISLAITAETNDYGSVMFWLIALIIVILFTRLLSIFGRVMTDHFQEKLKEKIREGIIEKAYRLSLANFDRADFYDRLGRVNHGMDKRLYSTMTFIVQMITQLSSIISIIVYLLLINWLIPVVLLFGSVLATILKAGVFKKRFVLSRKQTTPARKLSYLGGLMTGRGPARELRLYNLQDYIKQEWNQINSSLIEERLGLTRKETVRDMIGSSGNTLTLGMTLLIIIFLLMREALSIGQYAAFIRAVMTFQDQLTQFMYNMVIIQSDLRYINDFFVYMDQEEEKRVGIPFNPEDKMGQGIQFHHVNFSYPESTDLVIKDVNFKIRPGEKIALIGDNGSGKSTLIKLLLGLYQPIEGKITIDGLDLAELDLNEWWKLTTAVFQDFQKFQLLTVRENIAIGQTKSMDDIAKVREAALLSSADDMIQKLPDKYESILGKEFGGTELSQGQWQRIAIARAYIRDAELLILDEPTASLDAKAEYEIYREFEQISQDRAVVFISHRLGVAKLADRIIVLNDGQIIEQGSHAELIKSNGHYAKMYQLQAQWYNHEKDA